MGCCGSLDLGWEKFQFNENKKKKKSKVGEGGKVLDDGTNRKEKISGEEWCTCGSVVEVRGIKIYIYIYIYIYNWQYH